MNIKEILKEKKFKFEKKYGQNFITDKNLLSAIVEDCKITKEDSVLEIGPGAGTLTQEISKRAKKVLCYEIDTNLKSVLEQTLFDCKNVEVVYKDFMKVSKEEIVEKLGQNFILIANLPYYITTPIIFKAIELKELKKMFIMVQKEVAERICAKSGKDYGILSVMIDFVSDASITRIVNRNMFTPTPNVDSAIIKIEMKNKGYDCDYNAFSLIVHSAFSMRRKTLANNLMNALKISREQAQELISPLNPNIRAEELSTQDFVNLAKKYMEFVK